MKTRIILFRGQEIETKEWVEGHYYYCIDDNTHKIIVTITVAITQFNPESQYQEHIFVTPKSVGQFIELSDKNGKKIFYGDIAMIKMTRECNSLKECSYTSTNNFGNKQYKKIEYLPSLLIWDSLKPYFYNKQFDVKKPLWIMSNEDLSEIEIIGNTTDNPELLT